MIINDSNKIIYLGNGATKEWPFSFSITQASDIKVSLVNLDGEILNISSDYYVDIQNKKVLYPGYVPGQEPSQAEQPPILLPGWKIIIYRSVPVTQETDLGTNWPFNRIEESLDKLTMIVQDQKEQIDRSVKVDMNSEVSAQALIDSVFTAKNSAETAAANAQTVFESVESTAAQTLVDISTEKSSSIIAIQAEKTNAIETINPLVSAAETAAVNSANSAIEAEISKQKAYEYAQNPGIPVGFEYTIPYTELQAGQIPLLGGKYLKSTYTDLWAWVQTHPSLIKTETQWQAMKTASGGRAVPFYADVDEQYFRVPLNTVWVKGASSVDEVGAVLEAGLPNITATAKGQYTSGGYAEIAREATGAFESKTDGVTRNYTSTVSGESNMLIFNASKSNAIYGKSTTVQPQSICRMWVVQAFGTNSNTGNVDVSQLAIGVTDLTTRVSTLESNEGFTIVYPNGGTKEAPASITVNSRYVMGNPFAGYFVMCMPQVLIENKWHNLIFNSTSSYNGAIVGQVEDNIVLQTALNYIYGSSNQFGITASISVTATTAPCRILVWKIGKVTA